MKRIAIIGSGHLGQQIAYHIHQDSEDKVVAFFDEFKEKDTLVDNIPIIGGNNDIEEAYENKLFDEILIAIGYKHLDFKKKIFEQLVNKIPFYSFIHSSVYLDPSAKIGRGTIIYPGCILDQYVEIGDNVLLNIGCVIAHDSKIGNHSFLSPAVSIAGFVKVEELCIIGINSTIIDNINITSHTQIGGATVVIKNLEKLGLYVGNPARFIK
ncbi:acetyltransferase [Empedobacter brevis]|uniref:acetyltransferase n=1 Tax=Empedobacter brevis TaxID=247 RepID=UPI002FE3B184